MCGRDQPEPKTAKASTFHVEQPFPDEAKIDELVAEPVADPLGGDASAPASVDRWTMVDPLPTTTEQVPYRGDDRHLRVAAETIDGLGSG